ncbi:MAG: M28 family peptidase [Pseudomonadota bacterium]
MRNFFLRRALFPLLMLACAGAGAGPDLTPAAAARAQVDGASMLKHIGVLASDEFEGRMLATRGETMTLDYLTQQMAKLGLTPGNPDGSWLQKVPLVGVRSTPTLSYSGHGKTTALAFPDDFVVRSWQLQAQVAVQASEMVFVGYGVIAPEFGWDDFKGIDVKGKTLVMLINDPPVPDPKDPSRLDPAVFGGKAMSYYGRWTYKYEIAARLGAAAVLIVHEAKPAAYPYEVVRTGGANEGFAIRQEGEDPSHPAVHGWLQIERAKDLLRAAGQDFDTLKARAARRDFKPVPLGLKADFKIENHWRDVASYNVIGKLEGSDPQLKDEYVVYSAHWDHFGHDPTLPGPRSAQIYHGAVDNASGVAALLELAKAYKALPVAPKRSILFLLPTAEERGLLGSYYYASHPLYPLARTLIDINMDMMNMHGRTRDVQVSGYGKSNTDEWIAQAAREQGRVIKAADAEGGLFFRSDHFSFAKQGVPVLFVETGSDYIGKPARFAADMLEQFEAHTYHKVVDTVQADWDLSGAVQDTQLLFQVGYDVAQGAHKPQWKEGAEFKAAGDALVKTGASAQSGAAR